MIVSCESLAATETGWVPVGVSGPLVVIGSEPVTIIARRANVQYVLNSNFINLLNRLGGSHIIKCDFLI